MSNKLVSATHELMIYLLKDLTTESFTIFVSKQFYTMEPIIADVIAIIEEGRRKAYHAVNTSMVEAISFAWTAGSDSFHVISNPAEAVLSFFLSGWLSITIFDRIEMPIYSVESPSFCISSYVVNGNSNWSSITLMGFPMNSSFLSEKLA